ncbi:uncharacterized protein angptl8 [Polymixia lowei]
MRWALCLLCAAVCLAGVHAGPTRKPDKTAGRAAPHEEVDVLMFGVIQFSESLNYVYESTAAKIARVSRSLKRREGTLQQLGEATVQAAAMERRIKEMLGLLQVQMAGLQAQTEVTKNRLASVEQEEAELKTKVENLETYLNNPIPTRIKELQVRAKEQSAILKSLQYLTQYQKQNLEGQKRQLSKLQKMSEATP